MAKQRKDSKGRKLNPGEYQTASGYRFRYKDITGKNREVNTPTLQALREAEKELEKKQKIATDKYAIGAATLNEAFDRYIELKTGIRENTRLNYVWTYERFVRKTLFGKMLVTQIKYSDVKQFYLALIEEGASLAMVENVNTVLSPTMTFCVRDKIIPNNPVFGVFSEVSKNFSKPEQRIALSLEEQRIFLEYTAQSDTYCHWLPLFTVLIGTGMRVSECLGLTWADIGCEENGDTSTMGDFVDVNHTILYYRGAHEMYHISPPKTQAGKRQIPIHEAVAEAFRMEAEMQEKSGVYNIQMVDGVSGFIFVNKYGMCLTPHSVNSALQRVVEDYNAEERIRAGRAGREAVLLPKITAHNLRHTFCTRLCESNSMTPGTLAAISKVMGHSDTKLALEVYNYVNENALRKLVSPEMTSIF